jgi:hypothetical protein
LACSARRASTRTAATADRDRYARELYLELLDDVSDRVTEIQLDVA